MAIIIFSLKPRPNYSFKQYESSTSTATNFSKLQTAASLRKQVSLANVWKSIFSLEKGKNLVLLYLETKYELGVNDLVLVHRLCYRVRMPEPPGYNMLVRRRSAVTTRAVVNSTPQHTTSRWASLQHIFWVRDGHWSQKNYLLDHFMMLLFHNENCVCDRYMSDHILETSHICANIWDVEKNLQQVRWVCVLFLIATVSIFLEAILCVIYTCLPVFQGMGSKVTSEHIQAKSRTAARRPTVTNPSKLQGTCRNTHGHIQVFCQNFSSTQGSF